MMLLAGLTARANGCDFDRAFWQRLEAMLEFLACCMDIGGNMPAFGDSDDAVIARFSPAAEFPVYRSLLATGAVLFGRGDFKHKAQRFDDKSRWLLGDEAAARFVALTADSSGRRVRRAFEQGGYYILGGELETAHEVRMVVDAAPLGYLSIAAHGHADALSFTLSVAGLPLLIDPGTYAYHTDRRWRDHFRGTSAHNTLRVDRLDQSVMGGPFLWSRHAQVQRLTFELTEQEERIAAEHDGYCRLADPVTHRREIVYRPAAGLIRVTDHLRSAAPHDIEIFWHFAEGCRVRLEGETARVAREGIELEVRWPPPLRAQLVRGSVDPPLGWISPRFDEKVAGDVLVVSGTVAANWQGVSTIRISMP